MTSLDEIIIGCPHCGEVLPLQIDCSVEFHTRIETCDFCEGVITLDLDNDERGVANLKVCKQEAANLSQRAS